MCVSTPAQFRATSHVGEHGAMFSSGLVTVVRPGAPPATLGARNEVTDAEHSARTATRMPALFLVGPAGRMERRLLERRRTRAAVRWSVGALSRRTRYLPNPRCLGPPPKPTRPPSRPHGPHDRSILPRHRASASLRRPPVLGVGPDDRGFVIDARGWPVHSGRAAAGAVPPASRGPVASRSPAGPSLPAPRRPVPSGRPPPPAGPSPSRLLLAPSPGPPAPRLSAQRYGPVRPFRP